MVTSGLIILIGQPSDGGWSLPMTGQICTAVGYEFLKVGLHYCDWLSDYPPQLPADTPHQTCSWPPQGQELP